MPISNYALPALIPIVPGDGLLAALTPEEGGTTASDGASPNNFLASAVDRLTMAATASDAAAPSYGVSTNDQLRS